MSIRKSALLVGVATLLAAGCGGGADVGRQLATNEFMRKQVFDALASNKDLAFKAVDRIVAGDSLRTQVVDHLLTNDEVAKQVLARVSNNPNAVDMVLMAAMRDSSGRTHIKSIVHNLDIAMSAPRK